MRKIWLLILLTSPTAYSQTNTFPSSGNVGIGTITPAYKLHVVAPENSFKARFQGNDGYIDIGPANSGWAHIYTDRSAFIFNASVYSYFGGFSSYGGYDLALQTGGSTRLNISNTTGNVGIGTSSPYQWSRLHIKAPGANPWGIMAEASAGDKCIGIGHDGTNGVIATGYISTAGASPLQFWTNATAQMAIDVNGNVGIGTTSPNQKLTVNGTIYGKEVKVDLSVPGPDYVFEKDYDLPSLEEVKAFVRQYKHLPEIPAAKEMETHGINLSEMNMLLLKKVEELTLYLIDQNQQLKVQQQLIEQQNNRITQLENQK